VPITPLAALAVLVLVIGLVGCGGGDGEGSSSTSPAADQARSEGRSEPSGSKQSGAKDGEGGEGGAEGSSRKSEAGAFTPKQHSDSGGGSKQFVQKGGDNSIQEFGEEAGQEDFGAAAIALHNFLDARAEGNWGAACQYMSKGIVESFEKLAAQAKQVEEMTCAGILGALTNPAAKGAMKAEAEAADVGSLRTDGDRAFIIYRGAEKTIFAMPVIDEGGAWKVASLAGTPLN
jgi:hypothetical protein